MIRVLKIWSETSEAIVLWFKTWQAGRANTWARLIATIVCFWLHVCTEIYKYTLKHK